MHLIPFFESCPPLSCKDVAACTTWKHISSKTREIVPSHDAASATHAVEMMLRHHWLRAWLNAPVLIYAGESAPQPLAPGFCGSGMLPYFCSDFSEGWKAICTKKFCLLSLRTFGHLLCEFWSRIWIQVYGAASDSNISLPYISYRKTMLYNLPGCYTWFVGILSSS